MQKKPDIQMMRDGRVILRGTAYAKMKAKLRGIAENRCEKCGKYTPNGDPHHIFGRGAGKRDDRIFVNGKRNLEYICRSCHNGKHVPEKVVPAKPTEDEFNELLGL